MIAGAKILERRIQHSFLPDQVVMHGARRATFIRMQGAVAIIRHWGESRAVGVPPENLSHPSSEHR
jgi:hypothetical protein